MPNRPIPFRSSLIVRSLLSIFALMLLILGGASYISIQQLRANALQDMLQENRYIVHITTEALDLALWNLDQTQVAEQLESLKSSTNFCGARVRDAQGNVFVQVDYPDGALPDQFITSEEVFYLNPTKEPPARERIGTVDLCTTKTALDQRLNHTIYEQMIFMALLMLAVLGACYMCLLILARPLLKFRQAMIRLSQKMEPITDLSLLKRNEIGALSFSFNTMVGNLTRTYQQLRFAKEQAEKADQAKSEFLANMTHELRTPLNSIIGVTNLLREREHAAEERHMLEIVHQSSNLLLEVVNDILDISKIEAGEIQLEHIGFDLEAVVKRSIMTLNPLAQAKALDLSAQFQSSLPYLRGDPLRVGQIISNLISNAIKYTDKGAVTVHISHTALPDQRAQILCKVTDTGIGIPPEKIGQLFQKFTQVDASNTRRYGGTGLGLAITRQLTEMMQGQIGVESIVGEGTTFWVTLPFEISRTLEDNTHNALDKKRIETRGVLPPSHARILVAEDHPLNQAFVKLLLDKFGFTQVDLRDNGRDILLALEQKEYDLILMDCFMPEINGYDTTRMIRAKEQSTGHHLPVIAMTANAMLGDEQKCFAAGMDDYIAKPIIEKEFVSVLSRWIKFAPDALKDDKELPLPPFIPQPVDLSIMKTFSEGNFDIEKQLIGLFIAQSENNLRALENACRTGHCPEWVEAAHSLKGGAGGVGAESLRRLCEQAQLKDPAQASERQDLFVEIRAQYQEVKTYLNQMGY